MEGINPPRHLAIGTVKEKTVTASIHFRCCVLSIKAVRREGLRVPRSQCA